jgi:hypothetical protein
MLYNILQTIRKVRANPILLGRWCRTEKPLNDVKVDLANVDHCGVCFLEKKIDKDHSSKDLKKNATPNIGLNRTS